MILVLNCGSQSIKWKVYDKKLKVLQQGSKDVLSSGEFESALIAELGKITEQIDLIGHRVVHGGPNLTKPLKVTPETLQELEKISHFAPLHNPYNLAGIKICQKIFKEAQHFTVFDTEFFATLPQVAYTYALPENLGFRKYGFQGTSHQFVAKFAAKAKKVITVHLGGGASVTAIKNGKAIDTSMGFTPLEGLVMMTRSGNVDAGIVLELVKQLGVEGTEKMLNKESGIKGLCGESDMLKVLDMIKKGDKQAKLAFDVFVYSTQKYIGSYFAILGGCDVLIFTGSIGAGNPKTRNAISRMDILKKTKILAIKTDEELAIARKILKIK
ncbi:MAG TPA: acetate kinase [Candidatus Staskawiczbacteria bacterium]|nr:acetate kinase [Candidatus Staskawiczbacteria bacterium]